MSKGGEEEDMKRLFLVALVAILSVAMFLAVGKAQTAPDQGAPAPDLLQQELSTMQAVFGGLESFMGELIKEVKGSMAEISSINGDIGDMRNVISVISAEIKSAEGKLLGLRQDADRLAGAQEEFKSRLAALETSLSGLSQLCDKMGITLQVTRDDLASLNQKVAALSSDYEAFKTSALADIEALTMRVGDLTNRVQKLEDDELGTQADIGALKRVAGDLTDRVQKLEDEDVGTFKKKVIELERSMAALSIKIDNNRAKLEGFDGAVASLAADIQATKGGVQANTTLLEDHDRRLTSLEASTEVAQIKDQLNTLYFISIVGLLAGVGALIWGFMGK